jgi:hypothetical protein
VTSGAAPVVHLLSELDVRGRGEGVFVNRWQIEQHLVLQEQQQSASEEQRRTSKDEI